MSAGKLTITLSQYEDSIIHKKSLEDRHDSSKNSVFCAAFFLRKVYGPYFFEENPISRQTYLERLQQWLFLQIKEDFESFIFQKLKIDHHCIGILMIEVF